MVYYQPFVICITFIDKAKTRSESDLFPFAHICECIETSVDSNVTKNTRFLLADQYSGIRANRYEIIAHFRWFVAEGW